MIAHDSLRSSALSAAGRSYKKNGTRGAPEDEVAIGVVNERGDASVRVEPLDEPGRAMLAVVQVQVDGVVGELKLLQHHRHFPARGGTARVSNAAIDAEAD